MNNIKLTNGWYNYRTKEYDYLPDAPIEMGDTALEAARKVLMACLPKDDLTPTPPPATI